MTWTDLSWVSGDMLPSAEMTEMQANFEAMANGDSGAPRLDLEAFTRDITYTEDVFQMETESIYSLNKGLYNIFIDPSAFSAEFSGVNLQHLYNGNWVNMLQLSFLLFTPAPSNAFGIMNLYAHKDNEYRINNQSTVWTPEVRVIRFA